MRHGNKGMLDRWYGPDSPMVPMRMRVARRGYPASTRRGDAVRYPFPGQFVPGFSSASREHVLYVVERRTAGFLYLRVAG